MIQHYRRRTYYLLFAVLFSIFWFLFKLGGIPDFKQAVPSTLVDVAICLVSLLFSVEYLLPRYAYRQQYSRFLIFFFLLTLTAGSCIILAQLALMGSSIFSYRKMVIKYQNHYLYWFWSDLVFGSYFLVAFIATIGCCIRLAFDRVVAERKAETLAREKIQTDLIALKDQINPHFFFNALNTIYYQIDKTNPEARETLEQFSSLLRYQLYECDQNEVPVEQEARFLLNYIGMLRRRFHGTCKIEVDGLAEMKGFKILPYLLSPLIENCFKHVTRTEGVNSMIKISCHYDGNWFSLETTNTASNPVEEATGGIGLSNVRKRLALSYPDDEYVLSVSQDNEIFKLILKLKVS